MFLVDKVILVAGVMMVLGTLSSKFSARVGLPVLVLFLLLGMLAGSEGVGGIQFDNYAVAHAIGTVALSMILFDGGLNTPFKNVRMTWKPSALLATVGVLATSIITGLAAAWVLDLPLLEGILLGSIVGSTDAAAVFSLLRSAGIRLQERLSATLEIESGSNDPMAIFLTIGLLEVLLGRVSLGVDLLGLLALQLGLGAIVGLAMGKLAVILINRINLQAAGLYPVLTGACGATAFGLAAVMGGSGFLAIYLAGMVLGNSRLVFARGTYLFHDGLAWTAQIVMFVVLGLLSSPTQLLTVGWSGLFVAAVLIFVARPLVVFPLLLPFGFKWREMLLVSWVGLRGAVPIILATFPLIFGLPSGLLLFNVVFFVVLVSAIVQGGSLPYVARWLGLELPPRPAPPVSLEITSLFDMDADIVEYVVKADSQAAGRRLNQLSLPNDAVVAMISRSKTLIPPRGSTQILTGDYVFVVLRRESRAAVDMLFTRGGAQAPEPILELPGGTTLAKLAAVHEIRLTGEDEWTLEDVLQRELRRRVKVGDVAQLDGVLLRVHEVRDGRIVSVSLQPLDKNSPQYERLSREFSRLPEVPTS